jgi:membrane-associated phospholipid phosphatase
VLVVYTLAVLSLVLPAVLVPLGWRIAPAARAGRTAPTGGAARRLSDAAAALTSSLGAPVAALVTLLAGAAAVIVVCWPLGEALSRFESIVDVPVFDWMRAHHQPFWVHLNDTVTMIGDRPQLKLVSVVAAGLLAILWRRRWWIPVVVMAVQFGLQQYCQQILALVVDRGHPSTALGTYPSGGCSRVLMTFGVIVALLWIPGLVGRRIGITLATVVAMLAGVEGYTRVYVLKHWATDVIGGWVFGALLLAVVAFALAVLADRLPAGSPTTTPTPTAAPAVPRARAGDQAPVDAAKAGVPA